MKSVEKQTYAHTAKEAYQLVYHVIAPRDDVMERSYFKSFSSSKMVALVGTLAWRLLLLLIKKLHLKLLKHKSLAFMLTGLQQQN